VLVKIEMNVSGSSWKGRDSLSPKLVEYLKFQVPLDETKFLICFRADSRQTDHWKESHQDTSHIIDFD